MKISSRPDTTPAFAKEESPFQYYNPTMDRRDVPDQKREIFRERVKLVLAQGSNLGTLGVAPLIGVFYHDAIARLPAIPLIFMVGAGIDLCIKSVKSFNANLPYAKELEGRKGEIERVSNIQAEVDNRTVVIEVIPASN